MTDTPLSDDVVERVARAMFDHEWAPSDAKIRDGVWRDEAHSGYFIEAAHAALEAARYGEPAWQPIETAPADTNVLLALPCGEVIVGYKALRAWVDLVDQRVEPTHWMPLPEPPRTLLSSIGATQ